MFSKHRVTEITEDLQIRLLMTQSLWFLCALSVSVVLFLSPAYAQESLNNLPLPRWASLASGKVNVRVGPGERYPIDWVLTREDLPVEIIQEFEHWRQIKLHDNTTGWVHRAMLSGARYGVIQPLEQLLYRKADTQSPVQAKLKKDVLVRLEKCNAAWCYARARGFEGWLPKSAVFGVYKEEKWD